MSASGPPITVSALEQFTSDLTALAQAGELDPVLERDFEIAQLIDVLLRRRQNNPLLIGEPGVGKTAIVEGFASRIASGDVPPSLKTATIRSLDLGLLLAGASVRGEFENRLKAVMKEVESAMGTMILFIDEAHLLIGTGGQADAANLLKPALARGSFKTIAATTHLEYRRYFEKDPAFARRFETIEVHEPTEEAAIRMLRPLVPLLEQHHQVVVTADAIEAAVRLSSRYMSGRQLPDKAVSVLDTSCSKVATSQHCTPLLVTQGQQRVLRLEEEIQLLEREPLLDKQEELSRAFDRLATAEMQLADLEDRWREERKRVQEILSLHARLRGPQEEEKSNTLEGLRKAIQQLSSLSGEAPLVPAFVDAPVVAQVIADQTGIPVGQLQRDELHLLLRLNTLLGERILGQPQALATLSKQLLIARTGIGDPQRPHGLFLLLGPSGVGKTETCWAVADLLYGGSHHAVVLNMAEYHEAHSISLLKGAPPGYLGYGESGILTEAIRRRPHTLLILDNIDQAHQDVLAVLAQAFHQGCMEDSQGRTINFRQTLVMMTANLGDFMKGESAGSVCMEANSLQPSFRFAAALHPVFPATFLDSLTLVFYDSLSDSSIKQIVALKLERLRDRLQHSHQIQFQYEEDLVDHIALRAITVGAGARTVETVLADIIMPEISNALIQAWASQRQLQSIHLSWVAEQKIKTVCR